MNNQIEKYLNKVTASIPDPEDAKMVRMELEDHIMTKVELQMMSGVDEDSAVRQVLADMGDEEELQEELGEVHSQYKMRAKIIYESEKGQCKNLAQRLGKKLGIPYADAADNPRIDDRELLIVIRKGVYGGGAKPVLGKYLQNLKKGKLQVVVMIYTFFRSGKLPVYKINQPIEEVRSRQGNEGEIIKKMMLDKGIGAVEERYCFRSYKRLGRIPDSEVMIEAKYFAKMIGTYL